MSTIVARRLQDAGQFLDAIIPGRPTRRQRMMMQFKKILKVSVPVAVIGGAFMARFAREKSSSDSSN
jgi:hypothetical protein